ncbi:MAG: hypothetical protein V3V10_02880 [Planctomycetota bacterium]
MALSPRTIKYIAVGVIVVVVGLVITSYVWDLLKTAIGVGIGVAFVVIGIRVMFGKGLPSSIEKAVNKATGGKAESDDKDKSDD